MAKTLYYGNPINRANPLMRGLVSRWKVVPWYSSGGRFIDLAGKNHGTLNNGPTWSSAKGRPGGSGSLTFTGSAYVAIPSTTSFDLGTSGSATFGCWCMRSGSTNGFALCNRTNATASGFDILINNASVGGSHVVRCGDGANSAVTADWVSGVVTGTWFHIAGVISRSANVLRIYGNGVFKNSVSIASVTGNINQSSDLNLGARVGAVNLAGNIDDAFFINRELSDSEVFSLCQATRQQYDPTLNWYSHPIMMGAGAAPAGNRRRRILMRSA